ncbi:MAG: hypothetical protein Q4E73_11505 [Lachnospiraceae bacterium]|nr:hypothetical protein [Lachnospiraceae bacterium]
MEKYEYNQTTTVLRHRNGIKAYKILNIHDNHLIFQLWLNSDEQGTLAVSILERYEVGQYVDMQVIRTSKTSYQVKLIGTTPKAFIPSDGRNIAI